MPVNEEKLTRENTPLSSINSYNFPSNSDTKPKARIKESVVKGNIKQHKKSWWKKIRDGFIDDDNQSIGDYLIFDIFIPAAKETISNLVSGGIDMLLFNERRHRSNRIARDGNKSYVSYSAYYTGSEQPKKQTITRRYSDFEDIVFENRGDAESVLESLCTQIEEYGSVTVADLYEYCGMPSTFTDQKYGWTNLRDSCSERSRDGYILRLPKARALS